MRQYFSLEIFYKPSTVPAEAVYRVLSSHLFDVVSTQRDQKKVLNEHYRGLDQNMELCCDHASEK